MRTFVKKIIDLVLYGNFWIAICALALGLQTQYLLLGKPLQWDTMMSFLIWSTLFLYGIHRIVGIHKLTQYKDIERYGIIARFSHHIRIYSAFGLVGTLFCLWQMPWRVWFWLVVPGILALGYVIPVLGTQNKRLRDLHFIKIFLVAIVWSWTTVILPQVFYQIPFNISIILMVIERALFIFAITLPFDIRDMKVDRESGVKTIPAVIGVRRSKYLGLFALLVMMVMVGINYDIGFYNWATLVALGISACTTLTLLYLTTIKSHDYLISGVIDGTMILQAVLVIFM